MGYHIIKPTKTDKIDAQVLAHFAEALRPEPRPLPDQDLQVLKAALGGDRVTLRVREFSDEPEALRVQLLLQACAGVRQVVVNRSQGFSLNLVVEHDGVVEQLRQQLKQANLPVFALAQSKPSLDDVYLQATGRTLMDAELAIAGQRDPKAERKQAMR